MTKTTSAPVRNTDRFYIGGEWVKPVSDAMIDVIDSGTEELYFSVFTESTGDRPPYHEARRRHCEEVLPRTRREVRQHREEYLELKTFVEPA